MTERRLTVSQARNLLRSLTERNQARLLRLGEEILNPTGDAKMAPTGSALTYRALEYFRERSEEEDPRIRVRILENAGEIEGQTDLQQGEEESVLAERSLERRAAEAAKDVASKAKDVAASAQSVQWVTSGLKLQPKERQRPDVRATLKEMERALRRLRRSTQMAIDECLGNQNPLVLDLIRDYKLDAEGARHGLKVACFATELAAHLAPETYFGKIVPDEMYDRLDVAQEDRDYTPEGLDRLRRDLFRQEIVQIFLGGFLHDAGLWLSPAYDGHEARGASIVSEVPHLGDISETLADIVLLHSDLAKLGVSGGVIRTSSGQDETTYEKEFFASREAAEESHLLKSGGGARLLEDEGLRKVLPVAIAEFVISASEDTSPRPVREVIAEAVEMGDTALYAKFMMTLCNSHPTVEAPPRALVEFDGRLAVGELGRKHLMDLDGDVGVSVLNVGWQGPCVIRILKKRPDGGLQRLERIAPGHPDLTERTRPEGYMYVPVGRMGNLTVTVVGILGKEAFQRNFSDYVTWVEQIAD